MVERATHMYCPNQDCNAYMETFTVRHTQQAYAFAFGRWQFAEEPDIEECPECGEHLKYADD